MFTIPSLSHTEININLGYVFPFDKGQFYIQSGAGLGSGIIRGKLIRQDYFSSTYEKITYTKFNLPVEIGIVFNFKRFGMGFKIFYNLNEPNPGYDIGISIGYNFIKSIE